MQIVINKRRAFKEKHENKYIKASKEDYEKAIELLKSWIYILNSIIYIFTN